MQARPPALLTYLGKIEWNERKMLVQDCALDNLLPSSFRGHSTIMYSL
jgi:hypothetical protein